MSVCRPGRWVESATRRRKRRGPCNTELLGTPDSATLLDTRSAGEHTGTSGPTERKGHIPGFQHLEWSEFLAEDGRFKSPAEINAVLADFQVATSGTAVVHCQSGGRAAFAALALELAGHDVKNYYCGWSEWSADEEAPVDSSAEEQPPSDDR